MCGGREIGAAKLSSFSCVGTRSLSCSVGQFIERIGFHVKEKYIKKFV